MEQSILQAKSFDLATSVYKKVAELQKKQKEFLLSQWWYECITTIALQMYLAQNLHTRSGLSISLYTARKACYKASFWTKVLADQKAIEADFAQQTEATILELIKMLQSAITTMATQGKERRSGTKPKPVS